MTGYTYGALLGALLVSLSPRKVDARGMYFGVPLSVLLIFALNWHGIVGRLVVLAALLILIGLAIWTLRREWAPLATMIVISALIFGISWYPLGADAAGAPRYITVAWPWNYPLGCLVTVVCGLMMGRKWKPAA
jgi:hypothetical protein